jgi:chromosome segregation ATPase
MTQTKKPEPVLIELDFARRLLDGELKDAQSQRDTAQQQLNNANAQMQQAQQSANQAQAMILTAGGAVQQCEAIIKKLETPNATPTPTP